MSEAAELNRTAGEAMLKMAASQQDRVTQLTKIGDAVERFPQVWTDYKKTSLGLPGEQALARDFQGRRDSFMNRLFRYNGADSVAPMLAIESLRSSLVAQQNDLSALSKLYLVELRRATLAAHQDSAATKRDVVIATAAGGGVLMLVFAFVSSSARRRERKEHNLALQRTNEMRRADLETRLQRALEMTTSEEAAYKLIEEAIAASAPEVPTELLVADSSRAHFQQVATTDHQTHGPGCGVTSPMDCPAASRGQTRTYASSQPFDACPHLRGRPTGECSAVCVPVSIAGKTVGVVHAIGPDGDPPDPNMTSTLELIARKTGEHIGMLRAFARSETQAQTDALTGLLNRRSLEQQTRELIDQDRSYIVVFGDLDHFKQVNDVYGHDAGDRALRLYSRVLRDSIRPHDLPARYGGEEFVVVLPDCTLSEAASVIGRIQTRLADALHGGTVPPFTCSFGVASSSAGASFAEVLESADAALLQAKEQGRDCWVIAGDRTRDLAKSSIATDRPELDAE